MCLQKESLLVNDYYFLPLSDLTDGLLSCLQKLPHLLGSPRGESARFPLNMGTSSCSSINHSKTIKHL